MPLILNIDTALENGFVGLYENDTLIGWQCSTEQKEHASFLQPAVQQLMIDAGKKMLDIDAVAVTIGPGSYTGLRVGLASAKGFCYALQKPLIAINTLEIIALATIERFGAGLKKEVYCPMIDARRMEVFTATYNGILEMIGTPVAMVLDENSFLEKLDNDKIVFSGNGMPKFKTICHHPNATFINVKYEISHLAKLAAKSYQNNTFENLAYVQPFYAKAFYSTQQIKN